MSASLGLSSMLSCTGNADMKNKSKLHVATSATCNWLGSTVFCSLRFHLCGDVNLSHLWELCGWMRWHMMANDAPPQKKKQIEK